MRASASESSGQSALGAPQQNGELMVRRVQEGGKRYVGFWTIKVPKDVTEVSDPTVTMNGTKGG